MSDFDKFRELPEYLWTEEERLRFKYCNPLAEGRISYVDENNNEITNSKDPLCDIKLIEYRAKHWNRFYPQYVPKEEYRWESDMILKYVIISVAIIIFSMIMTLLYIP